MPLLNILDSVDEQDRKLIWHLAEKYPFLLRYAEMGERFDELRPRLRALGGEQAANRYENDPEAIVEELESRRRNAVTSAILPDEFAKRTVMETDGKIALSEELNRPASLRTLNRPPLNFENSIQRRAATWAGVFLTIGAIAYPPWRLTSIDDPHVKVLAGWGWISSPPNSGVRGVAEIDFTRLSMEWVAALVFSTALYFAWPLPRLGQELVHSAKRGAVSAVGVAIFILALWCIVTVGNLALAQISEQAKLLAGQAVLAILGAAWAGSAIWKRYRKKPGARTES